MVEHTQCRTDLAGICMMIHLRNGDISRTQLCVPLVSSDLNCSIIKIG